MKTIAYTGGYWSTNIGNAFFQLGVIHAVKTALPNSRIILTGDQKGWLWYWKHRKKCSDQSVLIDDINCDYIIMSGPLFGDVPEIWVDRLKRFASKGTRILLLSAGSMRYSLKEYKHCRSVLKDCKPYAIVTRDSETYKRYSDLAEHSHDGICFAFFCDDYMTESLEFNCEDIVLNFDKGINYNVMQQFGPDILHLLSAGVWSPNRDTRSLKLSRNARYISEYDKYRIVRTDHEALPPLWRKILKRYLMRPSPWKLPNYYVSDVPDGYLHLYKNAKLTISERVHACVPAIAFGNYAWLLSKTKRARLFDRVGLNEITKKPVRGDQELLRKEKNRIIEFLRNIL